MYLALKIWSSHRTARMPLWFSNPLSKYIVLLICSPFLLFLLATPCSAQSWRTCVWWQQRVLTLLRSSEVKQSVFSRVKKSFLKVCNCFIRTVNLHSELPRVNSTYEHWAMSCLQSRKFKLLEVFNFTLLANTRIEYTHTMSMRSFMIGNIDNTGWLF